MEAYRTAPAEGSLRARVEAYRTAPVEGSLTVPAEGSPTAPVEAYRMVRVEVFRPHRVHGDKGLIYSQA